MGGNADVVLVCHFREVALLGRQRHRGEPLVLQGLGGAYPLLGVVAEHLADQVESEGHVDLVFYDLAVFTDVGVESPGDEVVGSKLLPVAQFVTVGPHTGVRTATDFVYLFEESGFFVSLEEDLVDEQLREYTAHAPHVDAGGVVFGPQEQFGSPVVQGHHVVGVQDFRLVGHQTPQTEVSDLDLPLVVEEQVG